MGPAIRTSLVWIFMLFLDRQHGNFTPALSTTSLIWPSRDSFITSARFLKSLRSLRAIDLLLILVMLYRMVLSPLLGGACRFEPSCSEYALQALRAHPLPQALKLIGARLLRCRPGGPFGFDPVPCCSSPRHHLKKEGALP
jgi:putative membrane protein insertion efficiency factor